MATQHNSKLKPEVGKDIYYFWLTSVRFTASESIIQYKNTTYFKHVVIFNRTGDNPARSLCLSVNRDRLGWCLQGTTQTSKKDTQREHHADVLLLNAVKEESKHT